MSIFRGCAILSNHRDQTASSSPCDAVVEWAKPPLKERSVKPFQIVDLTNGFLIPTSHLYRIIRSLNQGGLCILPSDTCYALAGMPMLGRVCDDVNRILNKGTQPLLVTFGKQTHAEAWVNFRAADLQLINDFTPGPLTVIASFRDDIPGQLVQALTQALNRPIPTLGVRFPDSPAELQLSGELERPLTTSAVLYEDGRAVRDFDDAIEIVAAAMERLQIKRELMGIRQRRRRFAGNLSTVMQTQALGTRDSEYLIYRHGEISEKRIRDSLKALDRRFTRGEVGEWT
jgi:tRNA A37 threonylcarbamoyladenosine synthetase subunit TsaC/SUA5/YrdC